MIEEHAADVDTSKSVLQDLTHYVESETVALRETGSEIVVGEELMNGV